MVRLDILGVQAFVFIAELGSFSSAAEHLHLSQTAVSRRLSKLEEAIGVELFIRTTRTLALSQAGKDFLPRARRIVRELSAALGDLKYSAAKGYGNFVLACLPTIAGSLLPPILAEYGRHYPRNRIQILDRSSYEIREAVLEGEADFGISVADAPHADLEYEHLFDDPIVAIFPSNHPLSKKTKLSWKELEELTLIGVSSLTGLRHQIETIVNTHKLTLSFTYEVSHIATLTGLVLGGAGIAILPLSAVKSYVDPSLKIARLVSPAVSRSISIFKRIDRPLSVLSYPLYKLALLHLTARSGVMPGP